MLRLLMLASLLSAIEQLPSFADSQFVAATDPAISFVGRWGLVKKGNQPAMVTVNSSSQIYLSFTGRHVIALFDLDDLNCLEEIVARVDDGKWSLFTVDKPRIELFPAGLREGSHQLEIVVKALDSKAGRWLSPLRSAVKFRGFELDPDARVQTSALLRGRPRLEFLGDAITQGDGIHGANSASVLNADALASFAWLAGEALGAIHAQIAFPGQGVLTSDSREVPPAIFSFPWNFAGSATDFSAGPDFLVINLGLNDEAIPMEEFVESYVELLHDIRERCPRAMVFAVPPFHGGRARARDVALAVSKSGDRLVKYVDSTEWLTESDFNDQAHLNLAGSQKAAAHLQEQLKPFIESWKAEHKQ